MPVILQQHSGVLRKIAKEVPITSITTPKIKKILDEMSQALGKEDDGVAIAAPQIGYSLRIFIVSSKIFDKKFIEEKDKLMENKINTSKKAKDLIFINPILSKLSKEKEWMPEGCLSVRWLYGKTYRSKKAFVEAYDKNGKKFKMGGSGLLAQIFQHETDHLKGILFIDHANEIKEELPPKKL